MYIDPNSGGMLFQALLVVFGVISGSVLIFSSRIKMGFAKVMRKFRGDAEAEELVEDEIEAES